MRLLSHRGRALIAWLVVFTFLDLLTTGLRFYAIRVQRRALRIDDYLIVVAVMSMLALDGCVAWAIHNGLGAHSNQLNIDQLTVQLKVVVSSFFSWTIATSCCKLAMLFFYLNIFNVTSMKKVFYFFIFVSAGYAVAFIPYFITQCTPVSAAWNPLLVATHCKPSIIQELTSVSVNMTLDLIIVLLPAPLVWNLQMPIRKKIAVTGVFSLGFCIVGVMLWRLINTAKSTKSVPDFPFDLYILSLQSLLELWLGILAANLPTLGPLLKNTLYPKVRAYLTSRSSRRKTPRASRKVNTFGSGGVKKQRRDEFGLLAENTSGSIEMSDSGNRSNTIHVEQNFFVTVEPQKCHFAALTRTPESA